MRGQLEQTDKYGPKAALMTVGAVGVPSMLLCVAAEIYLVASNPKQPDAAFMVFTGFMLLCVAGVSGVVINNARSREHSTACETIKPIACGTSFTLTFAGLIAAGIGIAKQDVVTGVLGGAGAVTFGALLFYFYCEWVNRENRDRAISDLELRTVAGSDSFLSLSRPQSQPQPQIVVSIDHADLGAFDPRREKTWLDRVLFWRSRDKYVSLNPSPAQEAALRRTSALHRV